MKKAYLFYFFCLFLSFAGCKEDEISRIKPTGEFDVFFDFPTGEITAPTKMLLVNRSRFSDKFLWKFPGGQTLSKAGLSAAATSDQVVPDSLVYSVPGTYQVTLIGWQDGKVDSVTKQIVVTKMRPRIVVPENILTLTEFEFQAIAFKFPDKDISFSWDFDEPGLTSTAQNPKVTFTRDGIHEVTLTVNDGVETMTVTANVMVQGELAKTLYFTDARTGRLFKKAFTQKREGEIIQLPLATGQHPWSVTVYGNRLVVSSTGANGYFTGAAADGRIFSMDLNGGDEKVITRGAGTGNDDPYASMVDNNGNVWWVSRNANVPGMRSLPLTAQDAAYPATKFALTAAQAGETSVYGWLDGGIQNVNGDIWFTKHGSAGRGLYKMTTTGQFIERLPGLKELKIRSFAVDMKNSKIYFAVNFLGGGYNKGLYVCNLDGTNITLIDALTGFSEEGNPNEQALVTAIAIDNDPDDGTAGYVYYGYRDAAEVSSTGVVSAGGNNSGVKRYPIGGGAPAFFIRGYVPYGLAIDHVRR